MDGPFGSSSGPGNSGGDSCEWSHIMSETDRSCHPCYFMVQSACFP